MTSIEDHPPPDSAPRRARGYFTAEETALLLNVTVDELDELRAREKIIGYRDDPNGFIYYPDDVRRFSVEHNVQCELPWTDKMAGRDYALARMEHDPEDCPPPGFL